MRALFPVLILLIVGALVAASAIAVGAPAAPTLVGYVIGIVAMVILSVYVNTRNARLYGRQVWEDQEEMEGLARHTERMRRDRVRRHAEAAATFPASDVA